MRHARQSIPAHGGRPGLMVRTAHAFSPGRLVRCPVTFIIVLLALTCGVSGLGDLIAGGPKPFAVLEMAALYGLAALCANLFDLLAGGAGDTGAGRPD